MGRTYQSREGGAGEDERSLAANGCHGLVCAPVTSSAHIMRLTPPTPASVAFPSLPGLKEAIEIVHIIFLDPIGMTRGERNGHGSKVILALAIVETVGREVMEVTRIH